MKQFNELDWQKVTAVDVDVLVTNASAYLTPVWPMSTFIACNPIHGYEDLNFEDALIQSQNQVQKSTESQGLQDVNREMIKWLSAFLDRGQATIAMPNRDLGFYAVFCQMSKFDRSLHQGHDDKKHFLKHLPKTPQEVILRCLYALNVKSSEFETFIVDTLTYLPGWAGYVKWISVWNNNEEIYQKTPINLVEFTAVRLIITCMLWIDSAKHQVQTDDFQAKLWLEQIQHSERKYIHQLVGHLKPNLMQKKINHYRADVQMVFCIDVRSEPFRKQIEQLGAYETFGFAGFFGLPVKVYSVDKKHYKDCCPALLKPRFDIQTILKGDKSDIESFNQQKEFIHTFIRSYQQLKYNYVTPFNLADAMGPWCGLAMLFKNFFPELMEQGVKWFGNRLTRGVDEDLVLLEIPQIEKVAYAKLVLELMGLTKNFAKVVVFCGHGSSTTNNPYASALDCGACGGNHGADNAKILAKILNMNSIREQLAEYGILIPNDTEFLAAEHDTTTDGCELFLGKTTVNPEIIKTLALNLHKAQVNNTNRRVVQLNQTNSKSSCLTKSLDWSEVRPEWGLARNAAFIVGSRDLTKQIDLEGRCFLHSYDWRIDDEGKLLEIILTAPMVVAQWINCQYLFSTLDNVNYGSGSKITHNLVGQLGVMQGNSSDLMHGLALQSVNQSDDVNFHQVQRLFTIVNAPKRLVNQVVQRQTVLQKLFFNQWVHLIVIDPEEQVFYRLNQHAEFECLEYKKEEILL